MGFASAQPILRIPPIILSYQHIPDHYSIRLTIC